MGKLNRSPQMTCRFAQTRCRPVTTCNLVDEIGLRGIRSEFYSISSDYGILLKSCLPEGEEVGRFANDKLLDIDGIERTHTTQTFKAI